jgi:DNA-binding MarR family transcriptional regulator
MAKRKNKISPEAEAYRIGDLLQDRSAGIGPAQLSALSVLVFGGPRSLKELAEAEQVRPPTMSRIVVGLERARLVRRKTTDDKRRMLLKATARGVKILQAGRRRRVEILVHVLREFSRDELHQAADAAEFMRKLIGKLS